MLVSPSLSSFAQAITRQTPAGVKMPITPEVAQYRLVEAFGAALRFDDPVALVSEPGASNGLYVVERKGRIQFIPDLNSPAKELFMDITARVNSDYMNLQSGAEGLTSVAFHPNYSQNGYFYVTYSVAGPDGNINRLARFERGANGQGNPDSELVMIDQPDQGYGHNFNDVKFGSDGYLYVAVGDEGDGLGAGDEFNNSQRIDKDFFSAILRLDVDEKPGSLAPNPHPSFKGGYKIPAENPYVNATEFNGLPVDPAKVRTEFYAVGFRNPWRISFDSATGALYAGDVGRRDAEEINIISRGGNYGWAFKEGANKTSALGNPPAGVTLTPPVLEYPHNFTDYGGMCVIGGEVYRGSRMPELTGAYIFSDYHTGHIWVLRHDGTQATQWEKIAGLYFISDFGIDPRNGDILMCYDKLEEGNETIFRLERQSTQPATIPLTLAETGLFQDLQNLVPVQGFVPYEVNVPLWSDGAAKKRWFGILDSSATVDFSREGNWTFPSGSIWLKHFEFELEKGNPATTKRLETRVLIKNSSNDGVYGVTYRWGDSTVNATLVPAEGMDESFEIVESGEVDYVNWRYPSRSECLACHRPGAGYALGFNTPQLNRDYHYPAGVTNQIAALRDAGYMTEPVEGLHALKRLANLDEDEWSTEWRVRSYLAANCSICHHPGGVERARWDGRISTPLSEAGIVNGELMDPFGHPDNRVVKPGQPGRSVLLQRMILLGQPHMPPLGVSRVHDEAVQLIEQWIAQDLQNYQSFQDWIAQHDLGGEAGLEDDPDGDGAKNWLEYLLETNPAFGGDAFRANIRSDEGIVTVEFPQTRNRGFEVVGGNDLATVDDWRPLDLPSNAPFYSRTNRTGAVAFPVAPSQNSFFRVRVYEP